MASVNHEDCGLPIADCGFIPIQFAIRNPQSAMFLRYCILFIMAVLVACSGCATVRTIGGAPKALLPPACQMTPCTAQCEDGVQLALRRYQPRNGDTKRGAVVLCHGIGENGNIFDLLNFNGLARYMAGEGLDVWVADLRGCGLSAHAPSASNCTIEDYVGQDVPAILSAVRRGTGTKKVVWVGHNLGACIALIFAATHPDEQDVSIVSVGASMTGQRPYPSVLDDEAGTCQRLMCAASRFPSFSGDSTPRAPKGWEALFYNPEHMPAETLEAMVRNACGPTPARVAKQFVSMLRGGDLRSADGGTNYAKEMSRIKCPAFFICGKADNLADTGSARRLYQTVSSPDKEFRLFCLTNGDGADFGNADLLAGPRAGIDVYPEIVLWAKKHL